MTMRKLKHLADVRVSTVDKTTVDGEVAVRLCNYVDVYNHELKWFVRQVVERQHVRWPISAKLAQRWSEQNKGLALTRVYDRHTIANECLLPLCWLKCRYFHSSACSQQ